MVSPDSAGKFSRLGDAEGACPGREDATRQQHQPGVVCDAACSLTELRRHLEHRWRLQAQS